MAKVLNSSNFQSEVLDNEGVTLVDFTASWCGPCKMLSPVIEELSKEVTGTTKVFKVDVDASGDLARQYGIMGVPTMLFFKGGKAVDKIVGFQPKPAIQSKLNQLSK